MGVVLAQGDILTGVPLSTVHALYATGYRPTRNSYLSNINKVDNRRIRVSVRNSTTRYNVKQMEGYGVESEALEVSGGLRAGGMGAGTPNLSNGMERTGINSIGQAQRSGGVGCNKVQFFKRAVHAFKCQPKRINNLLNTQLL